MQRVGRRVGDTDRISVTLPSEDRAVLAEVAASRDRSLSWMAAHAIRFYLAEVRKGSQLALRFEGRED